MHTIRSDGVLALLIAVLPVAGEVTGRGQIPHEGLKEGYGENVQHVVTQTSLKRSLKAVEFVGTEAAYSFLLNHLPFAADAVRALRIQNYRVKDNGDGSFTADDGAGVSGVFRLVYDGKGRKIYYGIGGYDNDWLKIRGKAVAMIEFEELPGKKMRNWVSLWFRFDSVVIGTAAKALSPVVGPLADQKINYFLDAARTLCRRIVEEPGKTFAALEKSSVVAPDGLAAFRRAFVLPATGQPSASGHLEAAPPGR
jgi:hypothetical protein